MNSPTIHPSSQRTPDALSSLDGEPAVAALLTRILRQEAEIESLCSEISARYEEATFVYRLTDQIGAVLGESAIADLVLREAAGVFGVRAGALWLKNDGSLERVARFAELPDTQPGLAVLATIATGRPFVNDAEVGSEAEAAVALPDGRGSFLGALLLRGRSGGRSFLTGDIKLMSAIAALAAAFIRNERLAELARRSETRRRESLLARDIHRGLLPRHDPLFAGLDVSGGFRAADGLGGDYYGYVAMADGSLGIAIADVSGHGVGAALYMAIAKGALETEARDTLSSGEILGRVNEVLASDFTATDTFATAVVARFLPDARRFVWSNAGHNPPLLLRADGEVEHLMPCGPALGVVAGARWRDLERRFAPGDALLMYTDGVIEAADAGRTFFGIERLIEAGLRPADSAAAIREHVMEAVAQHVGTAPVEDDLTVLVARGVAIEEGP